MTVEIFSTAEDRGSRKGLASGTDLIAVRVGTSVATLTAGEWAALIARPKPMRDLTGPSLGAGIDGLV